MCIFTAPEVRVGGTSIFARAAGANSQYLAYEMRYEAKQELAMLLPLPTPVGTGEDAVRFIDLSAYPRFFRDADAAFPYDAVRDPLDEPNLSSLRGRLEVHSVGSYEASFVPRLADFARLDARFRLPDGVWQQMPQYADWSFCVFKLKPGEVEVHPMAFEFPRRDPSRLFFPTVHVHDGRVHDQANFGHRLYCQRAQAPANWQVSHREPKDWDEIQRADDKKKQRTPYLERLRLYQALIDRDGPLPARAFMQVERAFGVLQADAPVYRDFLLGLLPNQDQYL